MKVKIKKLHPDAAIPKYAHEGDSGFDLVAIEDVDIYPGETKLIKTGISLSVDRGFELQIRPRSGLSLKTPLRVANSPGTIDSSYTGQIAVIMEHILTKSNTVGALRSVPHTIHKGERVAQGVVCPVVRVEFVEVESLDETDRNSGGFGSSGV